MSESGSIVNVKVTPDPKFTANLIRATAITYGVSGILVGVLGTLGFRALFGKKKSKK